MATIEGFHYTAINPKTYESSGEWYDKHKEHAK